MTDAEFDCPDFIVRLRLGEDRAFRQFKDDGHWQEAPRLWDELDPERVYGGRQLWDHVQIAIAATPASQRAVLVRRDMEGQDAATACEMLGLSPENQRVLLHRARAGTCRDRSGDHADG